MAAAEAIITESVDISDRIDQLREQEREYLNMFGRMTREQERHYINVTKDIRRLERIKRLQERPTLFQRVSTFVTGRRTAPIAPIAPIEAQVGRFIE